MSGVERDRARMESVTHVGLSLCQAYGFADEQVRKSGRRQAIRCRAGVWLVMPSDDELLLLGARAARTHVERAPDLEARTLREAAQDYREHVHDEHPNASPVNKPGIFPIGTADDSAREYGDRACEWLERRADLMGGGT